MKSIVSILMILWMEQGAIRPHLRFDFDIPRALVPIAHTVPEGAPPPHSEDVFIHDVPFTIIGNVATQDLILYRQEYISLPPALKNSASSITITSQSLGAVCGLSSAYTIKGCARSSDNAIFLDDVYRQGDMTHESIHTYSYQYGRVDSDGFQSAYAQEGFNIQVQSGNVHNEYEYFVSAYLLFMNDPLRLQSLCPLTYTYFSGC